MKKSIIKISRCDCLRWMGLDMCDGTCDQAIEAARSIIKEGEPKMNKSKANPQVKHEGDSLKVKHTPGPWKINEPFVNADGRVICQVAGNRNDLQMIANARLIAAAPELLQAVKDALLLAELHDMEGAAIDNYRAVILKAEEVSK